MELQELVSRGRFLFLRSPKKFELFRLVNGKFSAKELAIKTGRHESNILNDLASMEELELIMIKSDGKGKEIRKNNSVVYEKTPLTKNLRLSYFTNVIKFQKETIKKDKEVKTKRKEVDYISIPSEGQISQIINEGEGQLYEFKRAGVDIQKLTSEIAAFSNTKKGGLIFYGVEDDGIVSGSDKRRQELDAPLTDSIKRNIDPPPKVKIYSKEYLGYGILIILTPPRNKKIVHLYRGRALIRKNTVVCEIKSSELGDLHKGKDIC